MNFQLNTIIDLCKEIEIKSREVYKIFKQKSDQAQHSQFWNDLALDETSHIAFWSKLKNIGKQKVLKNPFDNIEKNISQLEELLTLVQNVKAAAEKLEGQDNFIRHAFLLETLLLHPSFTILFRSINLQIKEKTPEETYQEHINRLTDYAKTHLEKQEHQLHSLSLQNSLYQSTEIANLFTRIDRLEGLIPICAWCKNVREETNNWVRIEDYIMAHSTSEFTHGICPDCKHKM